RRRGAFMRRSGGADCGDPGGKLGRGGIAEGGVRSLAVVIADPFANRAAGMAEAEEQRLIEQLIPHPAVEALDECILHRLSRRNIVPVDLVLRRPGEDGVRRELRPVVGNNHAGLAAPPDQFAQLTRDASPRDRRVRNGRQAFPRHVVDDVENPKTSAAGELVMDEVHRPAGIGLCLDEDRSPSADGAAARTALAHNQAFLAIKAIDPVDPRPLAFPPQQDEQPPIAEAPAHIGEVAQPVAQRAVIRAARAVADHRAVGADDTTGPPLRQVHGGLQVRNGGALGGGPYHFFARSSRSAAVSSICSASSFFSFAFSSSSAFSRFASDKSRPPYLAFQLYSVASEIPCLRARSPALAPASCSRRTAMICSSVNRLRFIRPSLRRGRTLIAVGGKNQGQVSRTPLQVLEQPMTSYVVLLCADRRKDVEALLSEFGN